MADLSKKECLARVKRLRALLFHTTNIVERVKIRFNIALYKSKALIAKK